MSLFRYIAWSWDREVASQGDCARALSNKLQTTTMRSWSVGLLRDGLAVFYTGGHPDAVSCYPLPGEAGVVLGTVFLRGNAGCRDVSGAQSFACDAAQGEHIVRSGGRWLIEECWGRYVALFGDRAGKTFRVLRDPSGTMACLVTTFEGLTVIFSHPEDAFRLGVVQPSINWRYVAAHVSQPQLNGHETALNEISEICAGECLSWSDGRMARSFLWHPARFAKSASGVDGPHQWVDKVYSTVHH